MSDEEVIKKTASYWVSLGGDATGLQFCYQALLKAIKELTGEDK